MASNKPSVPKGTRDFSPVEMVRRNYIFDTIKSVFRKYGYQEIQTPSMENLSTLTGKYGDEGDKLIFKILNSGDFWGEAEKQQQKAEAFQFSSRSLLPVLSEKALRYDLTVPFARYVVMHQNEISFPFKRFQIQPVWRADRPQKGRYREFYQCDADVVGSESLLNEAEFVLIYQEALSKLGLRDFTIKINNRKILTGIAEIIGKPELIVDMTVAIDKIDKIGLDGVEKELLERGFTSGDIEMLRPVILLKGDNAEKLEKLKAVLEPTSVGKAGIKEIETIFDYLARLSSSSLPNVELDITLARGLNYYTGAIFEVKTNEVAMGSIGGGGRYDDLTGMFGLKGLTGAGISFGADRIYDVLDELKLFPEQSSEITKVLITNFDQDAEKYALPLLFSFRNKGIAAELYPSAAKIKKQMAYADSKNIPFVLLIGSEEIQSGELTLKDMKSGQQEKLTKEELIKKLS
ncbi:histidine--tRNA ligase [Pararcticibacter amylolyticus]|uniref:Histidine--tRNA ligase n=1 Tax=Pararcticibacter amylolyticus TaxID=2173175 RepID=A0A2U2PMI8_9SPHI|nr:histidine--tRNA ligase [Pararcticibacter amylolyticus]PWG82538.1 histidine--tRNA ligase [Pararcticibacter amylolyticus]